MGWCVGTTKVRNTDARFTKTIDGQREKVNFIIYYVYEIDDEEVKTVLRAAEHGSDEDGAWVLLEPVEPAALTAAVELVEPAAPAAAVEQVEPVEPEAPVPVEPVEPAVPVEPALAPALPADITVTFAYICSGGHTPHTCIAPDATIDQLARAAADLFEGASSLSSIEGLY